MPMPMAPVPVPVPVHGATRRQPHATSKLARSRIIKRGKDRSRQHSMTGIRRLVPPARKSCSSLSGIGVALTQQNGNFRRFGFSRRSDIGGAKPMTAGVRDGLFAMRHLNVEFSGSALLSAATSLASADKANVAYCGASRSACHSNFRDVPFLVVLTE